MPHLPKVFDASDTLRRGHVLVMLVFFLLTCILDIQEARFSLVELEGVVTHVEIIHCRVRFSWPRNDSETLVFI
jgi:hypothetical protein